MLNANLIKTLNSKNISIDSNLTKLILNEIWKTSTKQQKEKAVELGGYTDTRSFNKARTSGLISVRMVIALAITMDVDPFYIIASSEAKANCTDEKIKDFLSQFGYAGIIDGGTNSEVKQEVLAFINELLEGLDNENINAIESLSNEELETLLKSYLIRARIGNEKMRLFLIKLLLTRR